MRGGRRDGGSGGLRGEQRPGQRCLPRVGRRAQQGGASRKLPQRCNCVISSVLRSRLCSVTSWVTSCTPMFLRECPRILIEGTRPAPRCLQGGRSAGVRKDSLVGVLGYGCGPACGAQSEEEDECSQEALTVCICSRDDLSCLLVRSLGCPSSPSPVFTPRAPSPRARASQPCLTAGFGCWVSSGLHFYYFQFLFSSSAAFPFPGNLLLSPADQFLFPTGGQLCQ